MIKVKKSRLLLTLFSSITLLLVLFACVQAYLLYNSQQKKLAHSQTWAQQQTKNIAKDLGNKMNNVAAIAEQLANEVNSAACSPCNLEEKLKAFHLQYNNFTSIGMAFDAGKSATEYRLYAPFIRSNASAAAIERLDSYYDYQANSNSVTDNLLKNPEHWFTTAKQQQRRWLAPFYESALDTYVIRYTAPILNKQQETIGLVFIDISLQWLGEHIEVYDLKDNNYLSLYNSDGSQLYHSLKGLRDIIKYLAKKDSLAQDQSAPINQLTNTAAWINTQEIAGTHWSLHTNIAIDTELNGKNKHYDQLGDMDVSGYKFLNHNTCVAWVSLIVLISILFFSCIRLMRGRTSKLQLWIDTAIYTTIFILGLVAIWIFEYGTITDTRANGTILANKAIIEKYERTHALKALASHDQAPTYIPVGLFIQSLEFLSATNVSITGYIWHRYQEGQESDFEVGTIFPEAIATNIHLAYEEKYPGETLKGWYFETTLRQNFNPDRFPLDRQSVWIRLWHEKIGDNIILVPDFKAYDSLNTRSLPGIEKDFVLSGWSLYTAYFEMRENSYNTRLGRIDTTSSSSLPELYFNIEIMRNFINPFLAHLFPLLVVVLMLYAIVITMSNDENKKDMLGFNAAGVVASCSALFFVALIAHVQMRNELAANSVVYLEYFYLITYIIILLITTNAVLISLKVNIWFIQFHDNLLPKLVYWPMLSGALFLCTVWTFR
jgi:hypothetical protein